MDIELFIISHIFQGYRIPIWVRCTRLYSRYENLNPLKFHSQQILMLIHFLMDLVLLENSILFSLYLNGVLILNNVQESF